MSASSMFFFFAWMAGVLGLIAFTTTTIILLYVVRKGVDKRVCIGIDKRVCMLLLFGSILQLLKSLMSLHQQIVILSKGSADFSFMMIVISGLTEFFFPLVFLVYCIAFSRASRRLNGVSIQKHARADEH